MGKIKLDFAEETLPWTELHGNHCTFPGCGPEHLSLGTSVIPVSTPVELIISIVSIANELIANP
jgi:hypothetical protein